MSLILSILTTLLSVIGGFLSFIREGRTREQGRQEVREAVLEDTIASITKAQEARREAARTSIAALHERMRRYQRD